jgi:predicted acyl esterase
MTSVEETRARATGATHEHRSEVRDGMRIDWDVPIRMDDGLVLRADVFRPVKEGRSIR